LSSNPLSSKSHGLISKLLAPACAAWLRTQVSEVESLDIQIVAGDRQILTGIIPSVAIIATKTVYRGISLQRIHLLADQIEINLGQVMRGKPLKLLQPLMVEANTTIAEADLLSSLTAPLLVTAVNELIAQAIQLPAGDWSLVWQSAQIRPDQLTLQGHVQQATKFSPIEICAGITLQEGHIIQLAPLTVQCELLTNQSLAEYAIDLGNEVDLQNLTLANQELHCAGKVRIRP
jgi:hypothetical protein